MEVWEGENITVGIGGEGVRWKIAERKKMKVYGKERKGSSRRKGKRKRAKTRMRRRRRRKTRRLVI